MKCTRAVAEDKVAFWRLGNARAYMWRWSVTGSTTRRRCVAPMWESPWAAPGGRHDVEAVRSSCREKT